MGREIVYCVLCGGRLTEDEFARGHAQFHDNQPFCAQCRPVTGPPPAPPPRERVTERRGPTTSRHRKPPTGGFPRIPPPSPPPGRESHGPLLAVGVAAGLAILVLLGAFLIGGKPRPPAQVDPPPAAEPFQGVKDPRPSPLEEAERRLRELEEFSARAADPQAVLARCDQLRSTFRGLPLEPRFKEVESRAQERLKEKERSEELERLLASTRKMIQEDPEGARRVDVEAMILNALKIAGERGPEVRKLREEYRIQCEEAAKRREAKKPPRPWTECFVEATKRVQAADYAGAKTLYLEGLATLPETRPEELPSRFTYAAGLYNLACISSVEASKLSDQARKDAVENAFKYLEWSLRSDFGRFRCPCHPKTGGFGHLADDKDFEAIRSDARLAELVKKYKQ